MARLPLAGTRLTHSPAAAKAARLRAKIAPQRGPYPGLSPALWAVMTTLGRRQSGDCGRQRFHRGDVEPGAAQRAGFQRAHQGRFVDQASRGPRSRSSRAPRRSSSAGADQVAAIRPGRCRAATGCRPSRRSAPSWSTPRTSARQPWYWSGWRFTPAISMPQVRARRATSSPMRPSPTMASFLPASCSPGSACQWPLRHVAHRFADATRQRQHQGEGVLGHAGGMHARRGGEHDAALAQFVQRVLLDPGARAGDPFQRRPQEFGAPGEGDQHLRALIERANHTRRRRRGSAGRCRAWRAARCRPPAETGGA